MAKTVIIANHHTKERVVAFVGILQEVRGIMEDLNKKLGGSWVYIQELKPGQVIPFTADKVYHGFDNNPEDDYCGNIITLREKKQIPDKDFFQEPQIEKFVKPEDVNVVNTYTMCVRCGKNYGEHYFEICP